MEQYEINQWKQEQEALAEYKRLEKEAGLKMVKNLMVNDLITIEDIIDLVIKENALIGVGLITLGDHLKQYCYNKAK